MLCYTCFAVAPACIRLAAGTRHIVSRVAAFAMIDGGTFSIALASLALVASARGARNHLANSVHHLGATTGTCANAIHRAED